MLAFPISTILWRLNTSMYVAYCPWRARGSPVIFGSIKCFRFHTAGFSGRRWRLLRYTAVQVGYCEISVGWHARNLLSLQLANLGGELVEALPRRRKSERGRLKPLSRSASRGGGWGQPSK